MQQGLCLRGLSVWCEPEDYVFILSDSVGVYEKPTRLVHNLCYSAVVVGVLLGYPDNCVARI